MMRWELGAVRLECQGDSFTLILLKVGSISSNLCLFCLNKSTFTFFCSSLSHACLWCLWKCFVLVVLVLIGPFALMLAAKLLWKGGECWKECLELLSVAEAAIDLEYSNSITESGQNFSEFVVRRRFVSLHGLNYFFSIFSSWMFATRY